MAHLTTNAGISKGREAGLGWLAGLRQSLRDYRGYRTTLAELEALSDRELSDLGISRLTLREVALEAVYGR